MTVFHDRRTSSFKELSSNFMYDPQYKNTLRTFGLSGGTIPTRPDIKQQYPVDQTTAVVNMR